MRRMIALGTAVIAAVGLLAVSSTEAATGSYEMAVGTMAPKETPWWNMLIDLQKQLAADTGGQVKVVIRPPGFIGELEMVEETRRGTRLQACGVTTAAIAQGGNIPMLQLVELPYLFSNNAEADNVMDNLLYAEMQETFKKRGFVLGGWTENGWRSFATKSKPIHTPEDLVGMKMRSQESDVHMAMYKAYGAIPLQKPMTEVLTALNTDIIEGLDNTALFIQAGGLAEPLKYFTLSRHIYQPAAVVFSRVWFDALPADLQTKVLSRSASVLKDSRRSIRMMEGEMMDNFEVYDVEVIELTPAQREAFASKARGMHRSFAATIDGGNALLDKIYAKLGR